MIQVFLILMLLLQIIQADVTKDNKKLNLLLQYQNVN